MKNIAFDVVDVRKHFIIFYTSDQKNAVMHIPHSRNIIKCTPRPVYIQMYM